MENIFFKLEAKGTYPKTICMNNDPTKSNVIDWLRYNFKHTIPDITATLRRDGFIDLMNLVFNNLTNPESSSYIDYELDGLVISSPDVIYHKSDYSYIYDECAFKFASEEKETTINNIKWELSRTQRYVPVLEIESVELSGATVQNITGNNAKYLIDNGLGVGAIITACRSGEVIPKHMNTLEPADVILPERCPVCGQTLVWDGVDLKCANKECANIKYSDLQQWCESVGETDGLQWTLMKHYLDFYNVKSISDLYSNMEFIWNDLSSRKLSITELKIKDFFEALYFKNIPVKKALIGLNIPRLGEKTSEVLACRPDLVYQLMLKGTMSTFNTSVTMKQDNKETKVFGTDDNWIQLSLLELVKEATTQTILENIDKFSVLRYCYSNNYKSCRLIFDTKKEAEITYVAVTGALYTMKRKAFEDYIKEYNYELSSNLKKCKYLITNSPNSGSTKNKDAQKHGILIVTENEFLELLK